MDLGVEDIDTAITTTKIDHVNNKHKNNRLHHQYSTASSDSITYHRDPFNQEELINTLRGKELIFFIIGYILAVLFILAVFEAISPAFSRTN